MALMDAIDESGDTNNEDTLEYKNRALFIINMLQNELYRYSDTYTATAGTRPVCTEVTGYDGDLGLDDYLARTILPYGLAYHLLIAEDPSTANLYLQRYQELIATQAGALPSAAEAIDNVYGGIERGSGDD